MPSACVCRSAPLQIPHRVFQAMLRRKFAHWGRPDDGTAPEKEVIPYTPDATSGHVRDEETVKGTFQMPMANADKRFGNR
jgi:hypothetical protein